MPNSTLRLSALVLGLTLGGCQCGPDLHGGPRSDGGAADAGEVDAGARLDAGDAGESDAGWTDAGFVEDGGLEDAGDVDAGQEFVGSGELTGTLAFPVRLAEIYRFDLGGGTPDWTQSVIVLSDHGPCTDRSSDGGNTTHSPDAGGVVTFARWDAQYLFLFLHLNNQLDAGVYGADGSLFRAWYEAPDAGSPFHIGAVGAGGVITSTPVGLDATGTLEVAMNHLDGGKSLLRGTYYAHFCGFL
jgi:hypothetical protein